MERICRYICLLCVCFMAALQVQANRRKVMECPGFVLSNTAEIEFKRIIQTSEHAPGSVRLPVNRLRSMR